MDTSSMNNTWSETIKSLEYEKKHLPWEGSYVEPVKRISLQERKRMEREYDPICMQYRDETKENLIKSIRAEQQQQKLLTTTDRLQQSFNIVSHQGPPRKQDSIIQNPRGKPTRNFNFVTNMKHNDHKLAPLLYDEAYNIEKIKLKHDENRAQTTHVKVRDFNMINNEYYENKEQRKLQEDIALKETLTKKFWDTHTYDPIKARYYDDNKEEVYLQQRQTLTEVHGIAGTLKLPPSVQYSDGNSYNILNHSVHDDQRLKATRIMEERSLNRIKRGEIEQRMRTTGEVKYDSAESKKLNKVSYKRWEGQLDRGFNMVNNTVTSNAPSPLPSRPPSMWSRLNTAPTNIYHNTNEREHDELQQGLVRTGRIRNLSGSGPAVSGVHTSDYPSSGTGGGMEKFQSFLNSASEVQINVNSSNGFNHSREGERNQSLSQRSNGNGNGYNSGRGSERGGERAVTSVPTNRASNGSRGGGVPSLDLTRTEFAEKVSYQEPLSGPKGLAVPIVRTGGFSSFRQ